MKFLLSLVLLAGLASPACALGDPLPLGLTPEQRQKAQQEEKILFENFLWLLGWIMTIFKWKLLIWLLGCLIIILWRPQRLVFSEYEQYYTDH